MDTDKIIQPQAFLDISINDKIIGKIIFQLFDIVYPKLCENFLALCTGFSVLDLETVNSSKYYKGSKILSIIPGQHICIGAFNSISPDLQQISTPDLTKNGYLALLLNQDTNIHYFIITLSPLQDIKNYLIFGHITKGLGVVKQIQDIETNIHGAPLQDCKICDCGIYDASSIENLNLISDGIRDNYFDWPEDELNANGSNLFTNVENIINLVTHIKYFGRILYKKQNYEAALQKYMKALRYLNAFLEYSHTIPNNATQHHHEPIMKLILTCVLNSAACKIQMKKFEDSLMDCDEAMDLDPLNPRVYLRKGQAYHGLGLYSQAIEVLNKGLSIKPHDKAMMAELVAIRGEINVYKIKI